MVRIERGFIVTSQPHCLRSNTRIWMGAGLVAVAIETGLCVKSQPRFPMSG